MFAHTRHSDLVFQMAEIEKKPAFVEQCVRLYRNFNKKNYQRLSNCSYLFCNYQKYPQRTSRGKIGLIRNCVGLGTFENHEKTNIRKLPVKAVINSSFIESRYLKLAENLHVKKW